MARRFTKVYQFKITLLEIVPPIWRRIEVPASYSFWDLHVAIQDAMGWLDYHLHAFHVPGPTRRKETLIGIPDDDGFVGDAEYLAGWTIPIEPYFTEPGQIVRYEYDFGDDWQHEILLEAIRLREPRVRYPRCLAGERGCPREDCGGVSGHESLLEILADPDHEEHESMVTWAGESYDPEEFDPAKVRFDHPRKRWETAFRKP